MPTPLSISFPRSITALINAGIRPGGGWSSCGARQLQAVAGWVFNFAHMFTYVQESSRWAAIYWQGAVTLNKSHWSGLGSKFASREQRLRQTGRKGIHLTVSRNARKLKTGLVVNTKLAYGYSPKMIWPVLESSRMRQRKFSGLHLDFSREMREHRLLDSCNPQSLVIDHMSGYGWDSWEGLQKTDLEPTSGTTYHANDNPSRCIGCLTCQLVVLVTERAISDSEHLSHI